MQPQLHTGSVVYLKTCYFLYQNLCRFLVRSSSFSERVYLTSKTSDVWVSMWEIFSCINSLMKHLQICKPTTIQICIPSWQSDSLLGQTINRETLCFKSTVGITVSISALVLWIWFILFRKQLPLVVVSKVSF